MDGGGKRRVIVEVGGLKTEDEWGEKKEGGRILYQKPGRSQLGKVDYGLADSQYSNDDILRVFRQYLKSSH